MAYLLVPVTVPTILPRSDGALCGELRPLQSRAHGSSHIAARNSRVPSGPVRCSENRPVVGFHGDRKANKPAALAFGFDCSSDHRENVTSRRKPQTMAVRQVESFVGSMP